MLVYVDQVTERLQFTFDFVFKQHGLSCIFTNDRSVFSDSSELRLNYSEYPFPETAQQKPSSLLFEEQINQNLRIEKSEWNGAECLSLNGHTDPFAAIFYLITRYEEYVDLRRDKHDRFEAKSSVIYRFGWMQRQIVERWVEAIVQAFSPADLPKLKENRSVKVVPSFDIDNTYAYKWKEGFRKWGSILKDYVGKRRESIQLRKAVNSGIQKDPYDTYERISGVAERFDQTRIFWLLGDIGEFDRNISWRDPRHKRLIRNMKKVAKVGLHPSYASNYSDKRLSEERQRLQEILETDVLESRQHFLKLHLPHTYRRLIAEGFKKDYTMGYADSPGFRLGTAHPVTFFDLARNEICPYTLVPFAYMDGTFNEYMQISTEESKRIVADLATEVKQYGGVFCFIWHNETIGENGKWKGWSELLDYTLSLFENESDALVS